MKVKRESEVAQSCPTPGDPMVKKKKKKVQIMDSLGL